MALVTRAQGGPASAADPGEITLAQVMQVLQTIQGQLTTSLDALNTLDRKVSALEAQHARATVSDSQVSLMNRRRDVISRLGKFDGGWERFPQFHRRVTALVREVGDASQSSRPFLTPSHRALRRNVGTLR